MCRVSGETRTTEEVVNQKMVILYANYRRSCPFLAMAIGPEGEVKLVP